ncbi:hypothetical protein B5S30_g2927 [[Candida] boidinii]|nr:hypothetical protein B5S30_g2927 [[Candida] boidinii]
MQRGSPTDHDIDIEQNFGNINDESHELSGKRKIEKKGKQSNSSSKDDNTSIPVRLTRKLSARPSFYKKYNFKDSIGYKIRRKLVIVEKKIGPFVKRVIPNFIVAHYVYIISFSIIGSILLYPQKNISYIDALFIASCSSTQAGLTTVDINTMKLYQQIVIYMITMFTTPIFIHSFLVIIRLYWFEQQFDNIKEKSKLNFQMRRTATLANMRTAGSMDSAADPTFAVNFTNKLNFFKSHTKKNNSSDSNVKVTEGTSNGFFENLSSVDPKNTSAMRTPSQFKQKIGNRRSSGQGFGTHNASEELNRRLNRAADNNDTTPQIQDKSNPDSQSTGDSSLEVKVEDIELEDLNNHNLSNYANNKDLKFGNQQINSSEDEDNQNDTVLHLSEPSDSESDTEIRPIENLNYSNKTQPSEGHDTDNIQKSKNNTTDENTNSMRKNTPSKDIKFANLPKPSRRKEMDPGELYMSISMLQHNKKQSQADVESGPALVIKGPAERSRRKLPGHDRRLKKLHKLRKLHKQQRQKMKEAEEKEERLLLQQQQREQQRRRMYKGFETDYIGNFLHENSSKNKHRSDDKEPSTESRRPSLIEKDSKFSRPNILRRLSHGMIGSGSGSVMTINSSTNSANMPSTDEKQTNVTDTSKKKFGNNRPRSLMSSFDSEDSESSDSRTQFSNSRESNSLSDSIHSMDSIDSVLSVHSEPVLEQVDNEIKKHNSNSSVKPLLKVQSHVPKSSEKVANFKRALTGEFPSEKKSPNKNSKTINFEISDNRNHDYQYTKQGVRARRDSRRRQSKSLNRKRQSLPAKLVPNLSFNGLNITPSNNSERSKVRRNGAFSGAQNGGNEQAVETDYSSEEDGYDDNHAGDSENDEEDDNYSLDSRYNMSTNYLSWNPTVGRNSTFVFMNDAQKEELGGVEYRALKLLSYILVIYYIGFHIICFTLVVPYIVTSKKYSNIVRESGVSPAWWSFFNAASFFNDLGYSLNPTSLVPFNQCAFILIVSSVFIVIGNTGFPIFLRFIIWIMFKLSTPLTLFQESLAFLLDHPRRCFTLLFPAGPTWWLFAVLVFLNCTDWVLFLILDFHSAATDGIPYGYRAFEGLFQAFSTRTAGFNVIDLSLLHPAIQVSYTIMMYISVLPLALSIRRTNVYEEQSLGIYNNNDDDVEEPTDSKRSFIGSHFRRQLSFDLWFVFLGLFIICIAEGGKLQSGDPRFTIFSCLFEIVSAYGTVGLSLGYPTVNSALASQFSVISKLVIIAMVIRGRHRGLPYSVDRAIMLARESVDMRDEYEASQAFRRTQTMQRLNSANSIGRSQPSEMNASGTSTMANSGINNRKFSRSETLSKHARRAASVASNLAKTVLLMNHKDVITPSHTMDFRKDFTLSSRNPMERQDTSFTHQSFDRRSHPGEQISNLNSRAHQHHNSSYHDDMEEIDEIPSEENYNEESAGSEHKSFQDFIQRKRENSEAKSK